MDTDRKLSSTSTLHERAYSGRGNLQVLTFEEAERGDLAYWHARTPEERLRHLESLRESNYGPEAFNQGLQRVLTVSERAPG